MKRERITAATADGRTSASGSPFSGGSFSPPPLPVLLRVPRMAEESESPEAISNARPRYRWRVGLGAAVLMVIVSLPWLIRWRPGQAKPAVTGTPLITVEESVEPLSPLQSTTKAAATLAFEADSSLATGTFSDPSGAESEAGEFWLAPTPSRGIP